MSPFHLAFPVTDLDEARRFYGDVLGCAMGRENPDHWIDFDLFGHQLTAHIAERGSGMQAQGHVDKDVVPIPHFGVILSMIDWRALADRLEADGATRWVLRPKIRFEGQPGEQATLFILDPSGNALEFKGFNDMAGMFSR